MPLNSIVYIVKNSKPLSHFKSEKKCLSLKELTDRDFHHNPSLAYLHISVTYSALDQVSCMIKWFILTSHIFFSHSVELTSSESGRQQHMSLQSLQILGAISETADRKFIHDCLYHSQ